LSVRQTGEAGTKQKYAAKINGLNMADRTGLGLVGFMLGSAALAVSLIAFVLVRSHVEGRLQLDEVAMTPQLVSVSTQ
jgi:hypothetical protein